MSAGGENTVTQPTIDPRVFDLITKNYNRATGIAGQPFDDFGAPLVADPSAATKAGQEYILGNVPGAGDATLGNAIGSAQGVAGFTPGMIGSPRATAASAGPASMYNPVLGAAAQGGPTAGYNPAQAMANPASASPVSAASIARGSVRDLSSPTGLGGISDYYNPYENSVVDTAMADIDRQRRIATNQNASNATVSNAFGGGRQAITDAETNRAYGDIAAQTAAQLRSAGFDQASNLLQQDRNRGLQAGSANQAADLSVASQNAGFGQSAGLLGAELGTDVSKFNTGILGDISQFNAGASNTAGQFGADWMNQILGQNLGNEQQIRLANMDAGNTAGQFGASATNEMRQFNAGNRQQTSLANQDTSLRSLLANQDAGIRGAGVNLSAAGLLGGLAGQEQQNALTGGQAILGVGAQQDANSQANIDAAYQEYLRKFNYPFDMQNLLNSALGMYSQAAGTQGSQQQKGSNVLGMIGSGIQGASMFLPF